MALNEFVYDVKSLLNIPKSRRVANRWFEVTTISMCIYIPFLYITIFLLYSLRNLHLLVYANYI